MITFNQINIAINEKIKKAIKDIFEYDVPLVAEYISEPIIRPSIKVIFENSNSAKFNEQCKERNISCSVYFFAKNRQAPKPENIAIREAIENEFINDIQVTDTFFIPVENLEFETSDGVLIVNFDLYTIELLPDTDTNEIMEEINFKI